jgi:4a-hydroxytetrahydrobiopterin dehydratase
VPTVCHDVGMADETADPGRKLTRQQASDAVTSLGWRYVLGMLRTCVPVGSLAQAAEVAVQAAAVPGSDGCLWMDVRRDRIVLSVQSPAARSATAGDVEVARQISSVVAGLGLVTGPDVGSGAPRSVQVLEIAIDALDIASIRPFWKAVMGYTDEAGAAGPEDALADAVGQGPTIWFQQMTEPRPQRSRIHFDVSVPHDEAHHRIQATLAAGGTLASDAEAPAFWVLADAEGNEACVTTWQGRDG